MRDLPAVVPCANLLEFRIPGFIGLSHVLAHISVQMNNGMRNIVVFDNCVNTQSADGYATVPGLAEILDLLVCMGIGDLKKRTADQGGLKTSIAFTVPVQIEFIAVCRADY